MHGLHTYNISLFQHYPISSAVAAAAAAAASGRLPSMSSFVSRKLSPRRNSSFELDIFDAKRYFSTAIDDDASTFKGYPEPARHQKAAAEKKSFGTISSSASTPAKGKGSTCNYKKCATKQPTSPGLRLASFINSLFQQAASKRKPKPLAPNTPTASQKSRSNEATYSCVSSGFTTPCLQFNTRSNVYKEKSRCRSNTNQYRKEPEEEAAYRPYSKNGVWPWKEDRYVPRGTDHGLYGNAYDGDQTMCGERRRRVMSNIHKYSNDHHGYLMKRDWSWVGGSTRRQRKSFNKRRSDQVEEHCDEDWESDSSSDLFELKIDNSYLGRHGRSGSLPVFGTANMKAFKRGTAIATTVAS